MFKVKSTNKDGVWCDNEISIVVRVEQPQWFQTLRTDTGIAPELVILPIMLKRCVAKTLSYKPLMQPCNRIMKALYDHIPRRTNWNTQ